MDDAVVRVEPSVTVGGNGTSGHTAEYKASEFLVDALADAGVRHIFGVIGATSHG